MKKINIWDNNQYLKFKYLYTIEELIENLEKNQTTEIHIKDEYIPGKPIEIPEEEIFLKQDLNVIYTDEVHPICISGIFNKTIISNSFFEKHKDIILETIKKNNLNVSIVYIDKYIYSEEYINQLIENNDEITIIFEGITPSESVIKLMKEKHIESSIRENNKDNKITTKYAIKHHTFKELQTQDKLQIDSDLNLDEINNLSFCKENMIIQLLTNKLEEDDYLNNVKKILDNIEDKNIIIKFKCEKRSKLEKSGILDLNFKNLNIVINNDLYDYPFEEIKKEEEKLNNLIKDIKDKDMTPFEKYIAIYNIVKNYKKYNENKDDLNQSRYLRHILDNEYIVCVGYAKLFEVLLDKVGIQTAPYSPEVDTSYDKGFTEEDIPLKHGGHARVMVNLQDEKYGIDGFYISDPTWDNKLEKDFYANMIMPMDYMQKSKRLFKLQTLDYFFDVHTLEEYNMKVNILLRKELSKIKPMDENKLNKTFFNTKEKINEEIERNYKRSITDKLRQLFITLTDQIKKLDYNKYQEIKINYKVLYDYAPYSPKNDELDNLIDNYYDFFAEIGPYIISKSNKEIPRETIIGAISQSKIKSGILSKQNEEAFKEGLQKTMEDQESKTIPYEFPDNYLSETDDGITVLPKKR